MPFKPKTNPKNIANIKFEVTINGYSPIAVDILLDTIIEDYQNFEEYIKKIEIENQNLKKELIESKNIQDK
ncbi:MAG: DivIVA domain-containing protein [Metamycoplasmataceae bacterium]